MTLWLLVALSRPSVANFNGPSVYLDPCFSWTLPAVVDTSYSINLVSNVAQVVVG